MTKLIFTYHSHHVVGSEYGGNDHVALPLDLVAMTEAGYRIVPLDVLVDQIRSEQAGETEQSAQLGASEGAAGLIALTFDDGPVYDLDDFRHPELGWQRGFVPILQDFLDTALGARQPQLAATSFVIASPEARRVMQTTYDREYTYLGEASMGDDWWGRAVATGLLAIANHSWDHLHPALERVAHSRQVRADFTAVDTVDDADAQILAAGHYIAERTGGHAAPFFAYPFGHFNRFLTDDYLPGHAAAAGLRAAVTTEPRCVAPTDSIWALPRYTCGHHWRTLAGLQRILRAG